MLFDSHCNGAIASLVHITTAATKWPLLAKALPSRGPVDGTRPLACHVAGQRKHPLLPQPSTHTFATPERAGGSKHFFVTSSKHTSPGRCWWSPGTPREGCWVRIGMNCGAVGSSRRTWGPAIRDGGAKLHVGAVSLLQRTSRCSLSARADTLWSSFPFLSFLFLSLPAQKCQSFLTRSWKGFLHSQLGFGLCGLCSKFSRCFQANSSGQGRISADMARQEMPMSATLYRSQP